MNISPVTSDFKRIESGIFAETRPQFDDCALFGMLAFRNGLEHRKFDFSMLIGKHFGTLYRNFIRFSLVTPEFLPREAMLSAVFAVVVCLCVCLCVCVCVCHTPVLYQNG